jgi:hypothetical protein
LIYRTGEPNLFKNSAVIKNVYRNNTSMVARLFAAVPEFDSVSAIQNEVNARNPFVQKGRSKPMQLGTVSKALKGLTDDLVVDRTEGIRLLQPEKLLRQLVDNYEPLRGARTRRISIPKTGSKLKEQLRQQLAATTFPVVASGLSSVSRYATMARGEMIQLFTPRIDALQTLLHGKETTAFADVELIETREESIFFDARIEQGFPWASPLQTYLELMAGDKRDRETAEQLEDLLLRKTKEAVT